MTRAHRHTHDTHHHTHTRRKLTCDNMGKRVHAHLYPTHTGPYKCTGPRDVEGGIGDPTRCVCIHTHIRTSTCVYEPCARLGQDISSQNRCRHCDLRRCLNGQNCEAERPVMARKKKKQERHSTEQKPSVKENQSSLISNLEDFFMFTLCTVPRTI